jgi:hypothetical protein
MLSLKFLLLAKRNYNLIFFRMLFLHFKFVVFCLVLSLANSNTLFDFIKKNCLDIYIGGTLLSLNLVPNIFFSEGYFNLFFSKIFIFFSNSLDVFLEVMLDIKDKFINTIILSLMYCGCFFNIVPNDKIILSYFKIETKGVRMVFQPVLFILFLYRVTKFLNRI